VVSQVLPAVRVLVAKDLIEAHELKPAVVASRMRLTPAAVTQYVSGARGGKLVGVLQESKSVKAMFDRLIGELLKTQPDNCAIMGAVCELCRVVREERMLCQFCACHVGEATRCEFCLRLSR